MLVCGKSYLQSYLFCQICLWCEHPLLSCSPFCLLSSHSVHLAFTIITSGFLSIWQSANPVDFAIDYRPVLLNDGCKFWFQVFKKIFEPVLYVSCVFRYQYKTECPLAQYILVNILRDFVYNILSDINDFAIYHTIFRGSRSQMFFRITYS